MSKLSNEVHKAGEISRTKIQSVGVAGKNLATDSGEIVKTAMSKSKKRASDVLVQTKGLAIDKSDSARKAAHDIAEKSRTTFQRNPFLTIAGVIAVGAIVGALIPKTRTENKHMRDSGRRMSLKARETFENLRKSGEDRLEQLGLNTSELADQARDFLSKLLMAAKNAAESATNAEKQDKQD